MTRDIVFTGVRAIDLDRLTPVARAQVAALAASAGRSVIQEGLRRMATEAPAYDPAGDGGMGTDRPVTVRVLDRDGSTLLDCPVVPDGGMVVAPGFIEGEAERETIRAALCEALTFLGILSDRASDPHSPPATRHDTP